MGDLVQFIKQGNVKEIEILLNKIDTIDLNDNSIACIGDEGMKALAKALESNKTIHTINLRRNSIGAEGMKALAKALESNKTIHTIDLDYNSIGACLLYTSDAADE